MSERIDAYISYSPNLVQRRAQRENFNAFIHYGLNTFTGAEWGDGKVDPARFNPVCQDTDQWCRTFADAGVSCVILTAKHHDGFCLWQTRTTEYNISKSPYKNGKGDVVKEVAESCKKFGLKLGIYLSPWDRNNPYYGVDNAKYNDIYVAQLTELLTEYGDIYYIWMDGACGAHLDGKPKQIYDFPRFYKTVRKLAPMACLSNCAPDIRWVGNEGGHARESEWNVVPKFSFDIQTIEKNSQQDDDGKFVKKGADVVFADLGSREFLANYDEFMWYPAEVDVSIRPGWFYHKAQDRAVRRLNNLMHIYDTSVGGNSLLLLNVPPDRNGLLANPDVKRLKEFGAAIRSAFSKPVSITAIEAPPAEPGNGIENVLTYRYNPQTYLCDGYYCPQEEAASYAIRLTFAHAVAVDKVRLVENTEKSQRIESYKIFAFKDGEDRLVYKGTTVGFNRIALFHKAVLCDGLTIVINGCRRKPCIEHLAAYETDGYIPKPSLFKKLYATVRRQLYVHIIEKENKRNK